jgi:hypothetical protein
VEVIMTKNNDNGKRNGKWIKLGKAIAALAVAVGALATSITGLVKSGEAQDTAKDVGTLAADLANNPESDAVYEALTLQIGFLERQIEALQRRVDDLQRDQARIAWRATGAIGPPEPVHIVAAGEGEGEGAPEVMADDIGAPRPVRKAPKKAGDLPALKKIRAKRAAMVQQVQEQVQVGE